MERGKYEKRVCAVFLYHAEKLLAYIRSGQHYTTLPIVLFDTIVAFTYTPLKDNCNRLSQNNFVQRPHRQLVKPTWLTTDFQRTRFVLMEVFDQ